MRGSDGTMLTVWLDTQFTERITPKPTPEPPQVNAPDPVVAQPPKRDALDVLDKLVDIVGRLS